MFEVHKLNALGMQKAVSMATLFEEFLDMIEGFCREHTGRALETNANGRELAIVRTKLQEASFFAKRAMAMLPENQETEEE